MVLKGKVYVENKDVKVNSVQVVRILREQTASSWALAYSWITPTVFSTDSINEEMVVKRNGMMWHLNPSDFVHADVLWYGYKDPQDIRIIMKLLNGNSTIFDVGANFGYYSMFLARKLGCRAFAFEPMPQNIVRFKKNLDVNSLWYFAIFCAFLSSVPFVRGAVKFYEKYFCAYSCISWVNDLIQWNKLCVE